MQRSGLLSLQMQLIKHKVKTVKNYTLSNSFWYYIKKLTLLEFQGSLYSMYGLGRFQKGYVRSILLYGWQYFLIQGPWIHDLTCQILFE